MSGRKIFLSVVIRIHTLCSQYILFQPSATVHTSMPSSSLGKVSQVGELLLPHHQDERTCGRNMINQLERNSLSCYFWGFQRQPWISRAKNQRLFELIWSDGAAGEILIPRFANTIPADERVPSAGNTITGHRCWATVSAALEVLAWCLKSCWVLDVSGSPVRNYSFERLLSSEKNLLYFSTPLASCLPSLSVLYIWWM